MVKRGRGLSLEGRTEEGTPGGPKVRRLLPPDAPEGKAVHAQGEVANGLPVRLPTAALRHPHLQPPSLPNLRERDEGWDLAEGGVPQDATHAVAPVPALEEGDAGLGTPAPARCPEPGQERPLEILPDVILRFHLKPNFLSPRTTERE